MFVHAVVVSLQIKRISANLNLFSAPIFLRLVRLPTRTILFYYSTNKLCKLNFNFLPSLFSHNKPKLTNFQHSLINLKSRPYRNRIISISLFLLFGQLERKNFIDFLRSIALRNSLKFQISQKECIVRYLASSVVFGPF
jgi:hypothetical protein